METEIEYDPVPLGYDFEMNVHGQLARIHRVHAKVENEGYESFDWGDQTIPRVTATDYEQATALRKALGMKDVKKHNCEHTIYYTGTMDDEYDTKVMVLINRSSVCTIEYVEEEVTEMVPDPDAELVEVTTTKTRTVYNCA